MRLVAADVVGGICSCGLSWLGGVSARAADADSDAITVAHRTTRVLVEVPWSMLVDAMLHGARLEQDPVSFFCCESKKKPVLSIR